MPSETRHVRAAQSNEALAVALIESHRSSSWAVVLSFYSALHWVDSFLARSAIHPKSHGEREPFIKNTQLRPIFDAYRLLSSRSRDTRYELRNFTEAEARGFISEELTEIKAHVQRLLAS
ncbi:MAG TPA: hypothetical protein VJB57_08290 [Dehalococcoidia bacterium]|nr:hypothetical protein [Dehalococcoidia bacterium]